jgi:hypothetical protein
MAVAVFGGVWVMFALQDCTLQLTKVFSKDFHHHRRALKAFNISTSAEKTEIKYLVSFLLWYRRAGWLKCWQ